MTRLYEDFAYSDAARAACFWSLPDHDWPILQSDLQTDVAIVGGGYTGLSAALHLAQAGAGVTLLEAQRPGWGASGRNGGFCCLGGARLGHAALARRFGAQAARDFHAGQQDAVDLVARLLQSHGIDAETHSGGELLLAHSRHAARGLTHEADTLRRLGERVELIEAGGLAERGMAGPGFHRGLHLHRGFALNPAKYAHGLALAAQKAGADIRCQAAVTGIIRRDGRFVLTTARGTVTARRLILATNGYSSEDIPGWLRARFLPVQSNILVTRPLSPGERQSQGWTTDLMAYDTRHLLHYFRLLPDGRFLFGLRGNVRAGPAAQAATRRRARADFERMFPAWRQVETPHFWSGLVCMSRGLTPYAGPLGGWENAWAGMAYHGNGVAMGSWTGALLAGMVTGEAVAPAIHASPLGRFPLGRARRLLLAAAYPWYRLLDAR